ncbi:hypothetical protein C9J21_21220 [Photobacterium phosphoreum]|uniref:hypothetical protein n=1 Tax=Photobacterium phosphoreum TaxID=659 RepID=UPI000D155C89|nr:hypothetical protein [Photobacterium phosphoreum]PSW27629.1 hypothetical protein C9J21_21220 [Photobacterium phosphoreum]
MSLEDTKAKLLTANETLEGLLTQINDLYVEEMSAENKNLKEALSELHNSREIDLVKIVQDIKNFNGHKFYTFLHVFNSVLPLLNESVEKILYCLTHVAQQASGYLAVDEAFKCFCKVEAHRPIDGIEFIMEQSELSIYAPFLSSSILAYSSDRVDEAIQITKDLIGNDNQIVRSQVYFSLGQLDVSEVQANLIWDLLSSNANNETDDNCRALILKSTLYFGGKHPPYWPQIEEFLLTFIKRTSAEIIYQISDIVAFQRVDIPPTVLHLLIKQLANVSPENNNAVSNINYVLVNLVEKGSSSFAVELLESILNAGVEITDLGYFTNELLSKRQELLNHIITKWFLSGKLSLCNSISKLLHDVIDKDIELKAEMTQLNNEVKQVFVAHKAIGWLFTRPISVASFILSIYETASPTTHETLEQALYDPMLLSYPGELKRFLQSCINKDFQVHLCERLLNSLDGYHTDIKKVFELKELMAPSENVRAYWKKSNKDMQAAYEEASKGSFIREIATTQKLLYGNSSIYYVHKGNGERLRQEMQMQSFSHSTEMPTLNVLDPESLDYILRIYRCERIKDEVNS